MLRFKLRAEQPEAEARLLDEAAAWHLGQGELSLGIECLLRARSWEAALDIIMGRGSEVFEKGEMATVIRWILEVPESARKERRDVSLLLGILKGVEGQAASAEDILGRVRSDPAASEGERACAQVFLASLAQWRPRPDVSLDMAIRALDQLRRPRRHPAAGHLESDPPTVSRDDHLWCPVVGPIFRAGEYVEAREWLERGLASPGATYPIWKVSGLGSLALLEAWCGNTERAAALSEEALSVAREVGLLTHPSAADAYLASALVAVETGEPRRAALSLHEGSLRAEANRRSQLSWFAHFENALLQEADGQRERAIAISLSTRSDLGAPPPPIVASRLLALHCRLLRLGGSPGQAQHALDRAMWYPATSALAFERVATPLALGDRDLARKLMDALHDLPDAGEPQGKVNGLLLRAWLADAEGSVDESRGHLAAALVAAEPHSLVESFVRAGPAIIRMVAQHKDGSIALRDRILSRASEVALPAPGTELVDPLTDRELEILSYLPSRFTNTELADHFYVSVNTIKTHMAHIYRKLDVANRNGAIARGRELGFLRIS